MVLNLGTLHNSHEGPITCLGLSADGSALCTGSWDSNLKVSMFVNMVFYKTHLGWRGERSIPFKGVETSP